MSFPRGRGRIATSEGRATVIAWCPLCRKEHRYEKGAENGEEIEEIRKLGFTDEWLPCQMDLPGNFWRVIITNSAKGSKTNPRRARQPRIA